MSRSRLVKYVLCVLSLLLLGGCADDLRHRNLFDDGEGEAMVSFSVEKISLTRADEGMDKETVINHAYLLFYRSDAVFETDVPLAAVKAELSASNSSSLTFKMPLLLAPDTDYKLLAIANADSYVPEGNSSFKEYLEGWSKLSADNRQPLHLFRADPMLAGDIDCLPMRGEIRDGGNFRFTRHDGIYNVSASLLFRRCVARIDVANMVRDGFLIEGIALCNWRDAVSVCKEENQLGNRAGSIRGILSAEGNGSDEALFVSMPSADTNGVQQLKESIYCFPTVSYESHISDRESTALIVKARFGDDIESSYYRVNVGMTGNKSEVKKNTKYLVTIQSVKGRGASTPEEAYSSSESLINLSVVEDWDLEGCFDMDDNGNFLVLSAGRLDFDGNETDKKEVRVLTSKGLNWTVDYVADNESSNMAFSMATLSDMSMAIGPAGKNTGEEILSGKFVVSAHTPQGGLLTVEIAVSQNHAAGSDEPSIPEDMPFALVPLSNERVKIDHNLRTIEIDGFDPECFNSFIDVPVRVYFNPNSKISNVNISTTLLWPLEGRVALEPSYFYKYCSDSFNTQGSGKVCDMSGTLLNFSELYSPSISRTNEDTNFYVSVGAMGPDDPEIIRQITVSALNEAPVSYQIKIIPHEAIIDDVVISDGLGHHWFVMDRNVQSLKYPSHVNNYIGRDSYGRKWQAYNYSMGPSITIPFKFEKEGISFSETKHDIHSGNSVEYNKKSNAKTGRTEWLTRYKYTNPDNPLPQFYDENNIYSWGFPTHNEIELCCKKMRISKMRLFLVSEFPAQNDEGDVPVCCYWPYIYVNNVPTATSYVRYGYFISEDELSRDTPNAIIFTFYDGEKVMPYNWTENFDDIGLSRLVRPLTEEELKEYKNNYLGYGSQPHRLKLCHPDTYESTSLGWIPY